MTATLEKVQELLKELKSFYSELSKHDQQMYLGDSTFSLFEEYMENICFLEKGNIEQQSLYFVIELCDFLMESKRTLIYKQDYLINKWNTELNKYIYSSKQIDEYIVFRFIKQSYKNKIPQEIQHLCFTFYHQIDYFKTVSYAYTERSKNKKIIMSNNDEYVMSFGSLLLDYTNINITNEYCWQFKIISGSKENVCIGIQSFESCEKSMVPETNYNQHNDNSYVLCNDGMIYNPYYRNYCEDLNKKIIHNDLVFGKGDIVCMLFKIKEGMLGFYVIKNNEQNVDRIFKYKYLFTNLNNGKKYRLAVGLCSASVQLI
eukprot:314676_1